MGEEPRYGFHPLERRGVLLGLDAGQILTLAGGATLALSVRAVLGGPDGTVVALFIAIGAVAAALWTKDGRPLGARAAVAVAWVRRGAGRARFDDAPVQGLPARRIQTTTAPAGIHLAADAGLPGERPLGVVRDRRAGTWAAVVPVRGCSFALLEPADQARKLEGWRQVLGSVARPGSPVVRLQWVQRTWFGCPQGEEAAPVGHRKLLTSSVPTMPRHEAWLVLVAGAPRPSGSARGDPGPARGVAGLRREVRLLEGQLRAADLQPLDPLGPRELSELVARPVAVDAQSGGGRSGGGPWPLATEDGWSAYRADGSWHATYWVAEWPRLEVGPDFLSPLLLTPARVAVSVIMAPVPAERAMREVRSARTADLADAQLRAKAGFLQSARRDRESEGVVRREEELADGHVEYRFSGYVTVSAGDREQLAAACSEAEHAAQSARLELRRLFGRQAEAYTWTLPLGRGLR